MIDFVLTSTNRVCDRLKQISKAKSVEGGVLSLRNIFQ